MILGLIQMLKIHSYSHCVHLLVVEPVGNHDEINGLLDNFEIVS
jgi:hypothetical protein